MSAPDERPKRTPWEDLDLSLVEFKIWDVTGQTVIQCNGVYNAHEYPQRRNLGAILCGRTILGDEVPLGAKIYAFGKEIQYGWRELSTPKE